MRTYLNGALNAQRNSINSALPVQPFFSGRYNPGASEYPTADVGEMILYYSALNDAQVIIVQNYLAAKFNVTMSQNDVYTADNVANGNFDFDVAGIGRVDASNLHNDARGTGMVRIFNPTNLGDNEFLMWGHDNGSLNTTNTSDIPAGIQGRLSRVWRVSEVNSTGTAVNVGITDIQFDLSMLDGPITASDLRLLIDDDGDGIFNEAGTIQISGALELACGNYLFAGVAGGSLTNGDRFTIGTINLSQTPLPISLLSFTGKAIDGDAHLRWTTATELNNDFFTVERSQNGKNFLAVGEVKGAGTTRMLQQYQFIDPFVPFGRIYYRLKQTDFDGQYTYSNVIAVENEPSGLKLIAIPNPLSQGQQLKLRITHTEPVDLKNSYLAVFDLAGKKVDVTATSDDSGQILLDFTHSQASGIYIISIRSSQLPRQLFTRVQLLR
jgi:hypothetical protein